MKISGDGVAITRRFFAVIEELVRAKRIRGLKTITRKYGMNRRHLVQLKSEPETTVLKPEDLAVLVKDYDVSADWLLTGDGHMFKDGTDALEIVTRKNTPRNSGRDTHTQDLQNLMMSSPV